MPTPPIKADVGFTTTNSSGYVKTDILQKLNGDSWLAGYATTAAVAAAYQPIVSGVSSTEIGYLDGVTSAIQTQIDAKLATATASSTYLPLAGGTLTGALSLTGSNTVSTYTAQFGWANVSYEALVLSIDALNLNVLTLKNTNTGNAFSALAFQGADGIEHGAIGVGNAGAGQFANATYLETSYFPTSGTNMPWPLYFVQTGYINGSNKTRVMAKFLPTGDLNLLNYAANECFAFDANTGYIGINSGASTNVAPAQPFDVKGTVIVGGTTGSAGRSLANGGGFALHVVTPQTTAVAGTTAGNMMRLVRDNVVKMDVTITGTGSTRSLNFVDTDNSSVVPLAIALTGTGTTTHGGPVGLKSYTVAGVPSAATAGQMIYVSNESGGAVPAFADGTNWRRVTDRAIVS